MNDLKYVIGYGNDSHMIDTNVTNDDCNDITVTGQNGDTAPDF